MALQPGFFTGPPPQAVKATVFRDGSVVYGVNPDLNRWIQNLWNWTVKFGNNADGAASFSGSIAIGTSPNWFKADSSGIWLGGATFGASPFRVSMAGALTATTGTFSGSITGATGTFSADIVTAGRMKATGGADEGAGSAAITGIPASANVAGISGWATGTGHGILGTNSGGSGNGGHFNATGTGYGVYAVGNTSKSCGFFYGGIGQYAVEAGGSGTMKGDLTGNVTGNASGSSGSCTGNAATATILATARNIGGVSFNGSAAIDPIQTKHAGDNSVCSFTGSPGATTYPLVYTVGKTASGTGAPALNRNADDGGTMAWYWLKVWSGSQFIYSPYMA